MVRTTARFLPLKRLFSWDALHGVEPDPDAATRIFASGW
jgi:hypothetical protein